MAKLTIDPKTDGALRIYVTDSVGTPQSSATAVADVFKPSGPRIAQNVALSNVGGGYYELAILASYSTALDGSAIEGVFAALITVTSASRTHTLKVPYVVKFA